MSEKIVVKAEKRDKSGKGFARRLRVAGRVPVTVYGGGGESVSVSANLSDLAAVIRSDSGSKTVFTLDVEGDGESNVIFQARQIDPIKGRLIHADLLRITAAEEKVFNAKTKKDAEDAEEARIHAAEVLQAENDAEDAEEAAHPTELVVASE
jgi:ribosomal protein L25 (general stress protein Ctc)